MANFETQTIFKQIAQGFRLTPTQVGAAFKYLDEQPSLALLTHYAKGDALGLSLSQWFKLKSIKDTIAEMPECINVPSKLQGFRKHDENLLKSLAIPLSLSQFSLEQLLSVIDTILQEKECSPNQIIKEKLATESEEILNDLQLIFVFKLLSDSNILSELRTYYWEHACVELIYPAKKHESLELLKAQWPQPATELKKINLNVLLHFFELQKSLGLKLNFILPQDKEWGYQFIAKKMNWTFQDKVADAWIKAAIERVWDQYLTKILGRDLTALAYDQMVEESLALAEFKLMQNLMFNGIGSKPGLLVYPHGRSGVMLLAVDANGEILDETMIYPYAPDYKAEDTLAHLAKIFIKYAIEEVGLIIKPETKKILVKALLSVKARYSDLSFNIHYLPSEITKVFSSSASKQPIIEDILKIAHFMQHPLSFWKEINPKDILPHTYAVLPKQILTQLKNELLLGHLLKIGIDLNTATKQEISLVGILSDQEIEMLIANRPYTSKKDILKIVTADKIAKIYPFIKVTTNQSSTEVIPLDEKMEDLLIQTSNTQKVSIADVLEHPQLLTNAQTSSELESLEKLLVSANLIKKPMTIFDSQTNSLDNSANLGKRFYGVVTKVMSYGLFIELAPGVEGLLHVSTLGDVFVMDLNLLFNAGDTIIVEWLNYDAAQKRLSFKYPLANAKMAAPKVKVDVEKNKQNFKVKSKDVLKPKKTVVEKPKNQTPNAMQMAFAKLTEKATKS